MELELDVWDGVESELYVWQKEKNLNFTHGWSGRKDRGQGQKGFPSVTLGLTTLKCDVVQMGLQDFKDQKCSSIAKVSDFSVI